MSIANRIAANTGILYGRMALTIFISLYSTRLILNGLGVVDFGIFNLVAGAIAMLTFLNTAMTAATQRFMSFTEGQGDFGKLQSIFNVGVVLHILIGLAVFIVLEIAGLFLFDNILSIPESRIGAAKLIYQFMIVSTVFTIISVPYDAVINAHENMILFAILGVFESVSKLGIAIYITYADFDRLKSYGFLIALLSLLLLIIRRIYCRKRYPECIINIKRHFSRNVFKEMTSFAGWSFLGSSTSMVANYGQGIIMNIFFGATVNAAQGIAAQVSGQLGAFAVTMLKALNPIIDKSEGAGNRQLMLRASSTGTKISFFLLILFYIPVLIEMPYIFGLWLGQVPEYVVVFCRLLLLRNLIEQLGLTLSSSIAAVGNIRKYQTWISMLLIAPLILSYCLFSFELPPYILYVVFLFSAFVNLLVTLNFAKLYCDLPVMLYVKDVIGRCCIILFLNILFAIIPVFILPAGLLRLTSVIFLGGISFIFLIWQVGLDDDEKNLVRRLGVAFSQRISKIVLSKSTS